jgi:hypothetical protein
MALSGLVTSLHAEKANMAVLEASAKVQCLQEATDGQRLSALPLDKSARPYTSVKCRSPELRPHLRQTQLAVSAVADLARSSDGYKDAKNDKDENKSFCHLQVIVAYLSGYTKPPNDAVEAHSLLTQALVRVPSCMSV